METSTLYCNVVNGIILQGPIKLLIQLSQIPTNNLKSAGWIPAKIIKPSADMIYYNLIGPEILITDDEVIFEYSLLRNSDEDIISILKNLKYNKLNEERDRLRAYGFDCNGYMYDSDITSIVNIIGKMVEIIDHITVTPEIEFEPFIWRTQNNSNVVHTSSSFREVFKGLTKHGTTVYITSWLKKKALIEDVKTLQEVESFDPHLS